MRITRPRQTTLIWSIPCSVPLSPSLPLLSPLSARRRTMTVGRDPSSSTEPPGCQDVAPFRSLIRRHVTGPAADAGHHVTVSPSPLASSPTALPSLL